MLYSPKKVWRDESISARYPDVDVPLQALLEAGDLAARATRLYLTILLHAH